MSKPKCVICGYYGQGNAGDEALLICLLQILPPHVEPIVLSGNPAATQAAHGVESYSRLQILVQLTQMGSQDFFIWGGGSLMQDATSIRSALYYGALMALAQWRGLTTIAWAQGIGPVNHPLTKWLAKKVLARCEKISVRDDSSANLLKKWHIQAIQAPDPVWRLASKPIRSPGIRHALSVLSPAPRIAVNLRSHPQLTGERLAVLTQALILFQEATDSSILLVPFQGQKDNAIAKQIARQLTGKHQVITLTDPREIKGLFQEVEMLIGMRLHSLIMAAAAGSRCFALSYDPKVSYLMAQLKLPGWELEEIPADARLIAHTWAEIYQASNGLSDAHIQALKEGALAHQQLLDNFVII